MSFDDIKQKVADYEKRMNDAFARADALRADGNHDQADVYYSLGYSYSSKRNRLLKFLTGNRR